MPATVAAPAVPCSPLPAHQTHTHGDQTAQEKCAGPKNPSPKAGCANNTNVGRNRSSLIVIIQQLHVLRRSVSITLQCFFRILSSPFRHLAQYLFFSWVRRVPVRASTCWLHPRSCSRSGCHLSAITLSVFSTVSRATTTLPCLTWGNSEQGTHQRKPIWTRAAVSARGAAYGRRYWHYAE